MSTPLTMLHNYPWAGLVLVGILWGGTNPFIKRGSVGINDIQSSNFFIRTLLEIKFLFTRWKVSYYILCIIFALYCRLQCQFYR
jgi:hypothetical protein